MEESNFNSRTTTIDIDVISSDNKIQSIYLQHPIQDKNELVLYKKSLSLVVENRK